MDIQHKILLAIFEDVLQLHVIKCTYQRGKCFLTDFDFLRTLYNVYYMSSRATIPEYLSLNDRKDLECYEALRLRHRAT